MEEELQGGSTQKASVTKSLQGMHYSIVQKYFKLGLDRIEFDKIESIIVHQETDISDIIELVKVMKIPCAVKFEGQVRQYGKNGKMNYSKTRDGTEYFYRYDRDRNIVHLRNSNNEICVWLYKYDDDNNMICKKGPDDTAWSAGRSIKMFFHKYDEKWYKYDKNGYMTGVVIELKENVEVVIKMVTGYLIFGE